MVISNCEITKQDSQVLRECVLDKNSAAYKATHEFHTGTDLQATSVYSAYDGTVVSVGEDSSGQSVIIQTGVSFCVCYKHLMNVNVQPGYQLAAGYHIGDVSKWVHVELLTHDTNDWPVRIGAEDWFKQDTEPLLNHSLVCQNDDNFFFMGVQETPAFENIPYNKVSDGEIEYILTNNKGDE